VNAFDPERILRTLAKHKVRYILVGATAARLQGFPRVTADADITPSPEAENLARLSRALRALRARIYTESMPGGLAFSCDEATLMRAELWNLITEAGRVDLIFKPSGTAGFDDLAKSALTFSVFGVELQVASLKDILRSKRASNRPQDRQDVLVLEEMLRRR
jgi:hypothetical protein